MNVDIRNLLDNGKQSTRSSAGFTLVELAVSLVVIGLMIGLGMSMVGPLMTAVKVRETKEALGGTVESVNSWAAGNNRLPDTSTGNPYSFASVVRTPTDAWGRNFVYLYVENLAPATATKDTICGRRTTLLKLVDTNISTTPIDNIAYIVFSKGDDAESNSVFTNGTLTPVSGSLNIDDKITTNAFLPTASTTTTTITTDGANDLVRWVTLDELRTKVGCQGAQLRIVNNELPFGAIPNAYSVKIYADGGVPFATPPNTYKWCVNTLPTGFSAPAGGIQNANCLNANEATWGATSAASELTISFAANATGLVSGSHQITVVVRDNSDGVSTSNACSNANPGDNCASKSFVLTINPQ